MKLTAIAPTITAVITIFYLSVFTSSKSDYVKPDFPIIINNPKSETIVYDAKKGLALNELNGDYKQLDIFNIKGIKVISINKFEKTIYLNGLKSGFYKIQVKSTNGSLITKTLVKI
ncbi:hypothetical protein [Winogradskyella sp. A2]|uniref:hypothetical protein n=1 Tax=Winogradskyella sp. A2 TaxID=3366944 RepID=UPI00398C6FB7